jgi:L-asparaginase
MKRRIALISTGGTIEKTYDELSGVLANHVSVLDVMLASLELRGVAVQRVQLMNKDSLDMTPADHTLIAETAARMAEAMAGVVVVHGTDRLAQSGERVVEVAGTPPSPVVFTGAMRPYELRSTDALQNLTEALLAVQLLAPGVYVAMHNQVLQFPGVRKDKERGTFVKVAPGASG